jgi:hypothetical protein
MRTFLTLILSAVVGFVTAYWFFGSKRATDAGTDSFSEVAGSSEKGFKLTPSREVPADVRVVTRTIYTTGTNKLGAREVLELLLKLHPNTGEESRNRIFRHIVYHLEMLAQMGSDSVPVIQEFLKKNQDVDYSGDLINASGERINRSGGAAFASRNVTRTDFIVPPSLRLGLVDVLEQIGTAEATQVLVEMLDTTGRGIEVAYLARVLQDRSPDEYRDNALKAAKDLLANPPAIDRPNRLDENSRAYLYSVLAMFNDTSFAEIAQTLLVTAEGRVDRQAMNYLSDALKEQAVPALYSAYKNDKLTNQTERTQILNALLTFTGPSAQANDVFREIVSDEKIPATIRGFTIQSLAGTPGREKPSDPQVIEGRLQFLRTLRDSFKDERILKVIDDTRAALEQLKNGVAVQ